MDRLIAIGDIHGCYYTFVELMKKVNYKSATDTLVFVGDYIDRGRNSYETVTKIRLLQAQIGHKRVICLRGNHEQMAIDAAETGDYHLWNRNGAQSTQDSFAKHGETIESVVDWFKEMPLGYDTPKIFFCHAGLTYPSIKENIEDDLLWGRTWIRNDARPREKQVIFGHTPRIWYGENTAYETMSGDICIDAGCVYGGQLCALVLNDDGTTETFYEPKNKKD